MYMSYAYQPLTVEYRLRSIACVNITSTTTVYRYAITSKVKAFKIYEILTFYPSRLSEKSLIKSSQYRFTDILT